LGAGRFNNYRGGELLAYVRSLEGTTSRAWAGSKASHAGAEAYDIHARISMRVDALR
jgi:hypothetical protein